MKKYILLLTVLTFASQSFTSQTMASEVWVTTNTITTSAKLRELAEHFRAEVKEADFISAFDLQLGHPATPSQMAVILDLDSLGRSALLNGNFKVAMTYYKKLEDKLRKIPNVAGVEKLTLSTLINLAHLSTLLRLPDAEKRWADAHSFSPKATLSPEEFSPAVILQFSKPHKKVALTKTTFAVDSEATLFVDGESIKTDILTPGKRVVMLEPGRHEACALLPGTSWDMKNFTVREGPGSEVTLSPPLLASGTCEHPAASPQALRAEERLVVQFQDDCSLVLKAGKWFTLDGKRAAVSVATALPDKLLPTLSHDSSDGAEAFSGVSNVKPPPHKSILSSPWFWIGLGVATGVTALVVSAQSHTTTVPTHTTE